METTEKKAATPPDRQAAGGEWLNEPSVAARYAKFREMIEPELAAKRPEEAVIGRPGELNDEDRKLRNRQNHAEYRVRKRWAARSRTSAWQ